jgi:hypothetical protein
MFGAARCQHFLHGGNRHELAGSGSVVSFAASFAISSSGVASAGRPKSFASWAARSARAVSGGLGFAAWGGMSVS